MGEGGYSKQLEEHRPRGKEGCVMCDLDLPSSPLGLKDMVPCLRKSREKAKSIHFRGQSTIKHFWREKCHSDIISLEKLA